MGNHKTKTIKQSIVTEAWHSAAEKSFGEIWNNKKDDKAWNKKVRCTFLVL